MRIKLLFGLWLLILPIVTLWWFHIAKASLESEFTNEIIETLTYVLSAPEDMRGNRQFVDRESNVRCCWDEEKQLLLITRQYLNGRVEELFFFKKKGKFHMNED